MGNQKKTLTKCFFNPEKIENTKICILWYSTKKLVKNIRTTLKLFAVQVHLAPEKKKKLKKSIKD